MIKRAVVERERQVKRLAKIETYAQHLTALKGGRLKRRVIGLDETQVTGHKCAVDEPEMHQVALRKITVGKSAVLILAFLQRMVPE